jgi:hypothetical protein
MRLGCAWRWERSLRQFSRCSVELEFTSIDELVKNGLLRDRLVATLARGFAVLAGIRQVTNCRVALLRNFQHPILACHAR